MLSDPASVAAALDGSALSGRAVTILPVPSTDDVAFAVACEVSEVLSAWRSARDLVSRTGRWPVVAVAWNGLDELFIRFPFDNGSGADTSVAGIVSRADRLDPVDVLADLAAQDDRWDAYEYLEPFEIPNTEQAVGSSPSAAEVRAALGPAPSRAELDSWLLEWEQSRGGTVASRTAHLEWFEPDGLALWLVLLPTTRSWEVPAYISFYGAEGEGGAERLVAVIRSWHGRYGAELVAHFGTMLEFSVGRPPLSLQEAWQLAREQELIAPCTTALQGVPLRQHARALVGRGTWFLHERP
jgi:hypothetical protein